MLFGNVTFFSLLRVSYPLAAGTCKSWVLFSRIWSAWKPSLLKFSSFSMRPFDLFHKILARNTDPGPSRRGKKQFGERASEAWELTQTDEGW